MTAGKRNAHLTALVAITTCSLLISACAPHEIAAPTLAVPTIASSATATVPPYPTPSNIVTPVSFAALTLKPGDSYFSIDGQPGFIFSRNVAGYQQIQYRAFLDWTKAGGSRFVRIQLDSLGMGYTTEGGVEGNWAAQWDAVFSKAEADGLYVLPVFSSWFDWNAGTGYSTWKSNPLNEANGGPVRSPAELFQKGSATQTLWMQWMQTLVKRWQARRNILAWEVFSEVNLASGSTESSGIDFVNSAARLIRAADPTHRPITASLADVGNWPDFYRETSIDFINIHPYPPSAQLDRSILTGVRNYITRYDRPVLIGESGLNAESPEKYAPNAEVGVRHAIWAGIVSGAMNGRSLYWEDSFAMYFPELGMPFVQKYNMEELPAVKFVSGVDFSGFAPVASTSTSGIWGAAIGNEQMVLGWYRDATSEPPDWKMQPVISKQTVTLSVSGSGHTWKVDFFDTHTGTDIVSSIAVLWDRDRVTIPLPDFTDDIAFKMYIP